MMTSFGGKQETKKLVFRILQEVAAYAQNTLKGHWSFFGPGTEEKLYGAHIHKANGSWNHVTDLMMIRLRESGHHSLRKR